MLSAFVILVIAAMVAGVGGVGFVLYKVGGALGKALPPGTGDGTPAPKQLPGQADSLAERGLRQLRVGDVVTLRSADFICEGAIAYEELGHRWVCGLIIDTAAQHWLLVGIERSSEAVARLLDLVPDLRVSGYPDERLEVDGVAYQLDKRGTATCWLAGDVRFLARNATQLQGSVERCRWWLYSAVGPTDRDTLLIEQWGADFRVLCGGKVALGEISLIQGS